MNNCNESFTRVRQAPCTVRRHRGLAFAFASNPSGSNEVVYFAGTAPTSYLDFGPGLTSVALNYDFADDIPNTVTVSLYSGANGTGSLLASATLNRTAEGLSCTPGVQQYCNWSTLSLSSASGTAESVGFSGTGMGKFELDGIQAGASPVPLPAGVWLLVSGLGSLGACARRRTVRLG